MTHSAEEKGITPTIDTSDMLWDRSSLVRMILEQDNHSVDEAGRGSEALERLAKSVYDVALLDIQLPVLDGLQTTRYMRGKCKDDDTMLNPVVPADLLKKSRYEPR